MRQWEIDLEESLKGLEDVPWLRQLTSDVTKTFYKKLEGLDLTTLTLEDLEKIEKECFNELIKK